MTIPLDIFTFTLARPMDNGSNRTTHTVKFQSRQWTILVEILNFVSLLFNFLKWLNNNSGPLLSFSLPLLAFYLSGNGRANAVWGLLTFSFWVWLPERASLSFFLFFSSSFLSSSLSSLLLSLFPFLFPLSVLVATEGRMPFWVLLTFSFQVWSLWDSRASQWGPRIKILNHSK